MLNSEQSGDYGYLFSTAAAYAELVKLVCRMR